MKKLAVLALTILLSSCAAAVVAYSMAHLAHHNLGIPSSALRSQALISAGLILGLVTIDLLATRDR